MGKQARARRDKRDRPTPAPAAPPPGPAPWWHSTWRVVGAAIAVLVMIISAAAMLSE